MMASVLLTIAYFVHFLLRLHGTNVRTCGAEKYGVLKILSHGITTTVEPRFNEHLYHDFLGITNAFFDPVIVKYMEKSPRITHFAYSLAL